MTGCDDLQLLSLDGSTGTCVGSAHVAGTLSNQPTNFDQLKAVHTSAVLKFPGQSVRQRKQCGLWSGEHVLLAAAKPAQ